MLSVLLINSNIQEYYQKYAYYFNWFEDHSDVAICTWNKQASEDAELDELAPQLFDLVKNVPEWNAYIVDEPYASADYLNDDFDNLTQHAINPYERAKPGEEYDPEGDRLLRLIYFLGGRSVEELAYIRNYQFRAARPTNIYLLTPRLFDELETQKDFLAGQIEDAHRRSAADDALRFIGSDLDSLPYSDFWNRYDYPPNCRFLVFDFPDPANIQYNDTWFKLWLATLTLMLNTCNSTELGPYQLYRMEIDLSPDSFERFLRRFYTALTSACEITKKDIEHEVEAIREAIADTSVCNSVESPTINVNFPDTNDGDFFPNGEDYGLTKDRPELDTDVWQAFRKKVAVETQKLFQSVGRAKAEAINALHRTFAADLEMLKYRQLNRFEIERLREELDDTEIAMLALETDTFASRTVFEGEMRKAARRVENAMPERVRTATFLGIMLTGMGVCLAGFIPFMISSARFSFTSFLIALLISAVTGAAVGGAALLALYILRRRFGRHLSAYTNVTAEQLTTVHDGAAVQAKYLTLLLAYMEKYQLLIWGKLSERHALHLQELTRIRAIYEDALEQCRSVAGLCHVELYTDPGSEHEPPPYFTPGEKIYLHEDTDSLFIPLNELPDRLAPPFPFVEQLSLAVETIYESPAYFSVDKGPTPTEWTETKGETA